MSQSDEKDEQILKMLRMDSSLPVSEIASELRMPRTTVQERIRKLVSNGTIKRFTVQTDYTKLGKSVTAFILVSFLAGTGVSQKEAAAEIAQIPDVCEVHVISGDWDIIAKARGESIQSIGDLVLDKIRNVKGVERTLTCTSFAAIKETV
ncbi:MAG: Lrp/AsnC family transcriptional regulator [Thaumarchaeota archaeon]|nr:Lrp/AsnC family transcriptional regulator [Nitrososphaerota archaeon]MCL5068654.1 Lrp/AsnC family transcriptional regulator [Nitrososphaerota archaeon]MDG6907856.1 Lrp/AsnC family transcriptional regulator [Nitrososphaerota archaeon]